MVKRAKRAKARGAKPAAAATPSAGDRRQIVPMLEPYFSLKEHGTDIRTEFIAGVTPFLTMVYSPAVVVLAVLFAIKFAVTG
jgi:hypothetical protein